VRDTVKYWLELSEYDLETAKAMLATKRFLYVGFMCHQSTEKVLKPLYSKKNNDTAPYTHSLAYLVKLTDLDENIPEEFDDFLNDLEPLNIEARYPSYKEKLLAELNESRCNSLILNTEKFVSWIKEKL
jgi:HEPN domain-containing protein